MQWRGIDPSRLYAYNWKEGDLGLFNNYRVIYLIIGLFSEGEAYILRQCNIDASYLLKGVVGR